MTARKSIARTSSKTFTINGTIFEMDTFNGDFDISRSAFVFAAKKYLDDGGKGKYIVMTRIGKNNWNFQVEF